MNYKEILNVIGKKNNKNELVEVYRESIDEYSTLMNIIKISDKLILGQYASDFFVNGYRVFRNSDITKIDTCEKNESLKFNNMIYNKKNLFEKTDFDIDIKDFKSIFLYLKNNSEPATIECDFEDAIDYYVGKILTIEKNIATVKCFDGSGALFKENVKINLSYVSSLTFGDRYTKYMSEFVNWQ